MQIHRRDYGPGLGPFRVVRHILDIEARIRVKLKQPRNPLVIQYHIQPDHMEHIAVISPWVGASHEIAEVGLDDSKRLLHQIVDLALNLGF